MSSQQTSKTVLIVEDQTGFRTTYGDRLALGGYQVLEAVNGAIGLEIMRRQHVDLVLLDLLMPQMSGQDMLREIRQDAILKDTPVVVFSVFDQRQKVEELRALGANSYLVKGIATPNDVLAEVTKLLNGAQ